MSDSGPEQVLGDMQVLRATIVKARHIVAREAVYDRAHRASPSRRRRKENPRRVDARECQVCEAWFIGNTQAKHPDVCRRCFNAVESFGVLGARERYRSVIDAQSARAGWDRGER
jgi:hypothetical protein